MTDTVFIYKKKSVVKVLDLDKSKEQHDNLIIDGFKHIVTLKSSIWLELILNLEMSDVESEIIELLNK